MNAAFIRSMWMNAAFIREKPLAVQERRMRDLNPRGVAPYTLSKRAHSATMRILRRRGYRRSGVGPSSAKRVEARAAARTMGADPSCGVISLNPPGPEGSKGRRALMGVRGVPLRRGAYRVTGIAEGPELGRLPAASAPGQAVRMPA